MHLFSMNWQQAWGPHIWELVGWTMCYFLAAGTFLAVLGYVVRVALRGASPSLRYAWSLTIFAMLSAMPIALAAWLWPEPQTEALREPAPIELTTTPSPAPPQVIDLKDLEEQTPPTSMPVMDYPQPVAQPMTTFEPATASAPPASEQTTSLSENLLVASIIQYLPWLWLVGTPLTFLLLATGLIGSHRLRHRSKQVLDGPLFEACQRVRQSLAVSRKVAIAVHERISSPLLIGIVRPIILLPPAALTGWTPEEIEMVLLHELAHVRRWDNLVNLVQRLVESLLFFHPCVWWVSRWVRHDREECCDAIVVARTAQPQAYAELLVALATPQPLAGLAMASHPLTGRIRKILKLEEERMLVSRGTIGMAGIALAGLLVALLWAPQDSTVAEETPQTVVEAEELTAEVAENAEEPSVASTSIGETPPAAIPVFLSLQQQRAADLAYKMLNTELGQLGVEELKRVQAMKFEGGLRVTEIKASSRTGNEPNLLQKGDLLVGLHVWPITSLEDVQQVLQREDIEELSPLKFYVIRRKANAYGGGGGFGGGFEIGGGGGYGGGGGGEYFGGYVEGPSPTEKQSSPDELITGRISVNVDALKKRLQSQEDKDAFTKKYVLVTGDKVKVIAAGLFPDQPLDDIYTVEPMGTLPLGPTYGRVKVVGLSLEEAEKRVQKDLAKILEDPRVQISLYETRQQREETMRAKTYPQSQDNPNQTETTLDEWGEPVKQSKAGLDALLREYDLRIASLQSKLAKIRGPRKTIHEQLLRQEQNGTVEARTRDLFTSIDLEQQKLLRQIQQAELEKKQVLTEQKVLQSFSKGKQEQLQQLAEIERRRSEAALQAAKQAAEAAKQRYEMGELTAEELRKAQSQAVQAELDLERAQVQFQGIKQQATAAVQAASSVSPEFQVQLAEIELRAAKANHEAASQAYTQAKQLHKDGIVSPSEFRKLQNEMRQAILQVEHAQVMLSALKKQISAANKQNTTLLYDNKTFDQWRSLWKNELKTEKRTEAIKALAAFGRAGYGKEAAEAILDVAGEYDFQTWGSGSAEGKLKEQVLAVLDNNDSRRISPKIWLPILLSRYHKNPKAWGQLATVAISQIPAQELDTTMRSELIKLATGDDLLLQQAAAQGLQGTPADDQTVIPVVEKLLSSEDPNLAQQAIWLLYRNSPDSNTLQVRSMALLLAALQDENNLVRKAARERLPHLASTEVQQIVSLMIKKLKNAESDADRIQAIRTLAAIEHRSLEAMALLEEFTQNNHSRAVRISAIYAYACISIQEVDKRIQWLESHNFGDQATTRRVFVNEQDQVGANRTFTQNAVGGFGRGGGGGGFF